MSEEKGDSFGLAWKVLFDEEFEEIPDPNLPANEAYHAVQRGKRVEAFKALRAGPGKILFEQWQKKIKALLLKVMFTDAEDLCACPACILIREARSLIYTMMDAESILAGEKVDKKKKNK